MQPSIHTSAIPAGLQFRLRSLLLLVTWLAVVFAVAGALPAVGLVVAVISVPALVRTFRHAVRCEQIDGPVSTGEMADTFLLSLVILVAIGTLWLLIAVAAAGVAVLAIVVAATRLCGVATVALTRAGEHAHGALRWIARATSRQTSWMRRLIAQPPAWGSRVAGVAILPGVLVCASIAIGLGCLLTVTIAFAIFCRSFAALGASVCWLETQSLGGLHCLLQGKAHLLHLFRTPAALSGADLRGSR